MELSHCPWLLCLCVGLLLLTETARPCEAASVLQDDRLQHTEDDGAMVWPVGTLLISLGVILAAIMLIFGCADFCQKQSGFKDFDNDVFSTEDQLAPVPSPTEFTMYPPVDSTPDALSSSPVVFEPLPDVTARANQRQRYGNTSRLHPRMAPDSTERSDSVDSLDDVSAHDSVQTKMKLQNLLTNNRHHLPRGQLQYIKELGNGWFGKALQGEGHGILPGHKKTKVVIQMLKEDTDTYEQLTFLEEATPYRDTDHHNVLKLIGQCTDTSPFLTVLELCPFGDLKTYLRSHRVAMESFNEKGLLLKFACDMAAGLQALHSQGFIHRDFATRNCLLAADLSVKIGDYGISEELYREDYFYDSHGDPLPIRWLPPETVSVTQEDVYLRRITKEANVWSYAVALWETINFGSLPYGDLSNHHVLRLVILERSVHLPKPDVSVNNLERLYQLLQLCWEEAENRPSLRELRIMLLHLLARKEDESSAFDRKWNQLMPRHSPKVTRVQRAPPGMGFNPTVQQMNGTVHTHPAAIHSHPAAVHSPPAAMATRPKTLAQTEHPLVQGEHPLAQGERVTAQVERRSTVSSVLSGDDLDISLSDLNASKIGLAGSLVSTPTEPLTQDPSKVITSPVNELSLDAELKAVSADSQEQDEDHMVPADEVLSPIKSESLESPERSPQKQSKELFPADVKRKPMPDVVASSRAVTQDFLTSTPKKASEETDTDLFVTPSTGGSTEVEDSQPTGAYHTAKSSYSTQSSVDRSLSLNYDDKDYMAPGNFANLLKTVPTSFSVDEEMLDSLSEVSPLPNDMSEDSVFRSMTSDGGDRSNLNLIADPPGSDTRSVESTPRNTPTPPLATSSMPLLGPDDLELSQQLSHLDQTSGDLFKSLEDRDVSGAVDEKTGHTDIDIPEVTKPNQDTVEQDSTGNLEEVNEKLAQSTTDQDDINTDKVTTIPESQPSPGVTDESAPAKGPEVVDEESSSKGDFNIETDQGVSEVEADSDSDDHSTEHTELQAADRVVGTAEDCELLAEGGQATSVEGSLTT